MRRRIGEARPPDELGEEVEHDAGVGVVVNVDVSGGDERVKRELDFLEASFRLHDGLRQSEFAVAAMRGPE